MATRREGVDVKSQNRTVHIAFSSEGSTESIVRKAGMLNLLCHE